MRMQVEPTRHLVKIDGIEGRIWNGVTESGKHCMLLVSRVMAHVDENDDELQRELLEVLPPVEAIDLRYIL